MEELFSQSSDRLTDMTTNPPEGKPDGIYTYPGVDASYKKENGKWYKSIGVNAPYEELTQGNVAERIKQLELNAVSVDSKRPNGIYTYPGVDALYKKEDGIWYRKTGDKYTQLFSGNVPERIKQLELNSVKVEKDEEPLGVYRNNQDFDVIQPVRKLDDNFQRPSTELFPGVRDKVNIENEFKIPNLRLNENEQGIKIWQQSKSVDFKHQPIDKNTGELTGPSYHIVYEDITDPKKVSKLNSKYNQDASTINTEKVFTGYPGKEGTEYIIDDNNLWKVKRPGSQEFLTITDPNSVKSLNSHFKQSADVFDNDKAIKLKKENEKILDLRYRINKIDENLIGDSEGNVVEKLSELFPEYEFSEAGWGTDNVLVKSKSNEIMISLDNWYSEDDNNQALVLRNFLRNNIGDIDEKRYKAVLNQRMLDRVENKYHNTFGLSTLDRYLEATKWEGVPIDIKQKTEESRKEFAIDLGLQYKETVLRTKDLNENEKNAALASLKQDKESISIINKYADDVKSEYNIVSSYKKDINNSIIGLDNKSKEIDSDKKNIELYIKNIQERVNNNQITQEELDKANSYIKDQYSKLNIKIEQYNKESDDLKLNIKNLDEKSLSLKNNLKNVSLSQDAVNKSIAANYLIKEQQGTFIGGLGYSAVDGILSIPRMIAQADKQTKDEWIQAIVGAGTTEEYMNSDDRWDLTKAAFQMSRSMSAMAAGWALTGGGTLAPAAIGEYLSLYAMSYYEMKDELDQMDIPGVSDRDKLLMSGAYGIVGSVLERFGLSYALGNKVLKRSISNEVLKLAFSQIPKNASKEMIEAQIGNSIKTLIGKGVITTLGTSLVEGGVEGSQRLAQLGIEEAYDRMKGTGYFNNQSAYEILGDVAYESYMGFLGGGIVETIQQSGDVLKNGTSAFKNEKQIQLLIESSRTLGIDEALVSKLKSDMLNGKITKQEAEDMLNSFKEIKGKINSIPSDMSIENQSKALDLILERDKLNKEIEGKDPNLVKPQSDRITEINNRLQELSKENAVQEPSTESVLPRQPETTGETGGEREGMGQGVQGEEVAQEGVEQAPIESKVQEIIPGEKATVADVDIVYPTEPQAEERKAFRSTSEYVENVSKELPIEDVETLTKELDGDFGLLTAENPMAQPLTEEENKQLNQKAEEWLNKKGYKPRRVTGKYGQAENSFFVPNLTRQDAIEFAKQFNQESVAHSDGLVYQDGSMNPRVKANDNLSFTESYNPGSDFVSVVNTKDGLKTFSIGYNFDEKVMPEQQAATQISEVTITPETSQTVTERINKETDTKRKKVFTAVQKVLSAIPNAKIILHDNTDAFVAGVAKSAGITNDEAISQGVNNNRGSYVNGDIHINLETAGVTTVFHEAFHDLLAKKGMDNNALLDMAKGLKSVISDKALKTRLDKFVSNYEQGERAEEYTTELGAIMAEAQRELSTTKFQQFKTLVNKIAKKLGLPVVFSAASTAQDAVDFMNSMSGKLGRGEQIEVGNVSKVIPSETDKYGNLKKPSESSIKNIKNQKPKIVNDAKSNVKEGKTVSTRLPKKDNIHSTRDYIVSMKSLEEDASKDKKIQDQYIKIAKEISSYGISKIKNVENFDDAKKVVNDFKNSVKSNLKWLHNSFGVDVRDISKLWYDGANIICNKIANQYNYSLEQVSGVMAVLSPQMDWFRNLSLGERVIDIYTNQQNSIFDSKMIDYVNNATSGTGKNKVPLFKDSKEIISRVKNKKLSELNNKDKAYFIRVFDEVYNSREYNNISPNGEVNGLVRKSDGSPGACGWGAFPTIEKSISILQDGSIENISSNLGNMHKVRNFFNNISNPNDPDAVTIDTHAVAAGLLLPLSGSSKQVLYNFGGAGNVNTGMTGTYPVYADAYRELAKELGLLPREVQSITWEAVRGLFKATFKSNKNNELNINKVWDDYSSGSISLDEAHTKIEDIAGGISKPVWFEYMADGNKISMDENSAAVDQSNLDNESIEPSKIKAQKVLPESVEKRLTEDGNGNYVFHHYSSSKRDSIKPTTGDGSFMVSKEEASALASVNGVAQYYAMADQKEQGTGNVQHTVLVPMNEVYYLQEDKLNLYDKAKEEFQKARPGQAFSPNYQAAWIGKVANDMGYKMLVSEWRNGELRAQTTLELKPESNNIEMKPREKVTFNVGDKVNVFGDDAVVTEVNGDIVSYKGDRSSGSINVVRSKQSIKKITSARFQKQSKEDAIQDAKDIHEKSFKRFKDSKRAIANAVNNLEKSKWYRDADDIQREEAVREIKNFFGEKIKSAPSVAKVTGKTKQTAFVSDLAAAIRDQIKLQARSSRETAKNINDRRKALGTAIKEVVSKYKGKITERQLKSINTRIANVNLFNQEMVERVIDYVNKVMNNAEYATKVNNAFAERRAIRRMMKSGNMAETVAVAKEFTQIDPSMVDDIDAYLEMAQKIRGAVKSSRRVGETVSLKQIVNFGEAYEYIKPVLDAQEESMKNMLLAEHNDLVESGVISKDMTLKDINKILNKIRLDEKVDSNEEESAREFLKNKLYLLKLQLGSYIENKGYNPLTGEVMDISDRNKQMIAKVVKSDMNNMSTKQMTEMVDSLYNFLENGAVGGIEAAYNTYVGEKNAASLEKQVVVARPLKMYFNKKLGQVSAYEVTSLTELFNRMFVGVTKGIDVMTDSGLADVILGANKARRQVKEIQDNYVKKFGKIKNFFQIENVYERGALAFLTRNLIGSDIEVKSEFNRRVDILLQSIDALRNGTEREQKMADVYEKVLGKLDVNSRDLNTIKSKASSTNIEAVEWWINEWSTHYSDLSDVSKSVYNTILGKDVNYTPDRLKTTSEGSSQTINDKILESKSAFLMNTDAITDTNESGVMIASVRPKQLPKGRYVSLDFDVNNIESLTGALVDINTAGAIRQVSSFFKSKSFKSIVPSVEDRTMLNERVNKYIRRAKNKLSVPSDVFRNIDNALNTISSVGTALGLGGVFQSVKQTVSVAMSTAIQTGNSFNIYAGKDFNNWLNTTGATVTNRGQESLTAIESANKKLQSFNGKFDQALTEIKKWSQWQLRLFLSKPDVFVARAAFKSYYEQYLKQNGYDVSKINWDTWNDTIKKEGIEELNKKAIIYADTMVSRQQNVSDERLAGELLANEDSARKLIRKVVFPFASFSINQRARLVADINALFLNWNNISKEDKAIAIKSIAGTVAEQAVFQSINFTIGMSIYSIAQSLAGHDDDDDEWEKRILNATKYPLRSLFADFVSPNPLSDDAVIFGADQLLAMMDAPSDGEIKQAIEDEQELRIATGKQLMTESQINKFKEEYIKENTYQLSYNFSNHEEGKYGLFSITIDQYKRLSENFEMAKNGTFTDEYMGKETTKYLTDKDKSLAMWVFYGLEVPYSTGAGLKEMGQVANKTYSIIKKRALTEDQYEVYKEFKKEFKREPQEWEINMIKSSKSPKYSFGAMRYVQDFGGLSNQQGKEYAKVFEKTGMVLPPAVFDMIKQGKSSDKAFQKYKQEMKKELNTDVSDRVFN